MSTLCDVCGHVLVSLVLRNCMFQNPGKANDVKTISLFYNRLCFICFSWVVIMSVHVLIYIFNMHFFPFSRKKVRAKKNESNQKPCLMQSAGGISF